MARGPKGNLDNVEALPLVQEPQAAHYAIADELRPGSLATDEAAVWDRIAPHLAMLGRLKPIYVDYLAEYCVVLARLAATRKMLNEDGWTYSSQTRNGYQLKSRPEVAQLNDDWRKMRSMVGSFGLAPAEERALKNIQGELFDDEFDSF